MVVINTGGGGLLKRMKRIRPFLLLLAVCIVILTACTTGARERKNPTIDSERPPALTANPTEEVPTEMPADPTGTLAKLQKSRELHEAIMTKQPVSAVGTGPKQSSQDLMDYEYGITRYNPVQVKTINLQTGEEASYSDPDQYPYVSGLADEAFNQRLNERILVMRETLRNPDYIPNVSGFLALVEEKGTPSIETRGYITYHRFGILSGYMSATWIWTEKKAFSSWNEEREFTEALQKNNNSLFYSYYNAEEYDYDTGASYGLIYYKVVEYVGFTYDISTGEELTLSDLFPEGYDYLDYLNAEFEKQSKEESSGIAYDEGYAQEHYSGEGTFYLDSLGVTVGSKQRLYKAVELPYVPANRDPDGIGCKKPVSFSPSGIGRGNVCSATESFFRCDVKVGEFQVTGKNGQRITISVFKEEGCPEETFFSDRVSESVIREQLTDEILLNLAKQSAALWKEDQFPKSNSYMFIDSFTMFPNNFFFARWNVCPLDGDGYPGYFRYYFEWFQNGRVKTFENLLDVPLEEFLQDVFTGAYKEDYVLTGDQAAAIAKTMTPYFAGCDNEPCYLTGSWYVSDFKFSKEADSDLVRKELERFLPDSVVNSILDHYSSDFLHFADPSVVLKHLRVYDGYSFR